MTKRKQKAIENLAHWTAGAILGAGCALTIILMQYIIYGVQYKFFWQL
jgi:hypothetical protein